MSKQVPNTAETPLPAAVPPVGELGPLVGKTFGGYEVSSYIGEGPTGQVYRAEDLMGSKMAVKVMHRELSQKDHATRLWDELKKLAATGDDHFVRVYDCGYGDDGDFFFLMDELTGVDLEGALEQSGAFAPRRAVEIVDGIAAALERAHTEGVVHGGLKPRNVFLSPTGGKLSIKVLDFGAARLAGGVDKGVIVGNPFYMAPEQFGGSADERTDVYSLGVMMYELFSGTLPFNGPTHGQVMMRHLAEPPQPPPGVDTGLARIILKALSKAPSDRFQSVAVLRDALKKWAGDSRVENAAASQVIARAAEARKIKLAALTTPDATVPASKIDAAELAEATRQQLEPSGGSSHKRGGNGSMNTTTRKEDNPNSSESVEASLEDFISQANATFPASDGWDLHTGDVELVDDEEGLEDAPLSPIVVKPSARKAETAAHLIKKADRSARSKKVTEAMLDDPNAKTTIAPPPTRSTSRRNPFEVQLPIEDEIEAEPAPLDPPPTGPRRRTERTEVVATARGVPWTANPMVWIAGVFAAFVCGAILVFVMVRTMMPSQPVVVQAPAPVVVPQPAAPAQPVVTPLDKQAQPTAAQPAHAGAQPVVTPLEGAARPPTPDEIPPSPVEKHAAPARHASAHHAKAPAAHEAKVSAPKAEHKAAAKAAASDDDDDDDSAPAAAPKKASKKPAAKSEKKGGGDWVDPFAQ
ncbi:MAG TPA: serine/threonine-protein kinase [Polyangia bacterium]|nr:serine/threonine-protein kinase [Polyangia bacterium]